MIKSVVHSDTEAIKSILQLHCNGRDIDLDPTYSIGGFYKNGEIKNPPYKFDIEPKLSNVIKADAADLPLDDGSVHTIVFDPPFLATTGPSLRRGDKSNKLNKRFGTYPSEYALFTFYVHALRELYRVCDNNGILMFKCQDKVSSGIQYFSHCYIYNKAMEIGWYPKDFFILLAKHRLVADWQLKNQKHSRKFHAYWWVFQKRANRSKVK